MQPILTLVLMYHGLCDCVSVTWVSSAKTAELIEVMFGLLTRGPKEPCIGWVHMGATWQIRLTDPCVAAIWAVIPVSTCYCCIYRVVQKNVQSLLHQNFASESECHVVFTKMFRN